MVSPNTFALINPEICFQKINFAKMRAVFIAALLVIALIATVGFANPSVKVAGETFLIEKETEAGVYKLPSGMLFKVLNKGTGTTSPLVSTRCQVHYAGTLPDGTKFDSSYDRGAPATFAPNQVIKGWTEALQLMREGDKWEVYIPYNLAYGQHGRPPKIPGYSPLVFQMELIKINGASKPVGDAFFSDNFGKTYAEL